MILNLRLLFFSLSFGLIMFLLRTPFAAAQKERPLKIGVSTALSGDATTVGLDVRDGILFANEIYGKGKVTLILEDDRCTPKDSASIAQKFVSIDKVDAVVGYACSGPALAAAPILEKAKIPSMVVSGSAKSIRDAGDYMFRSFPGDQLVANILGSYIARRNSSVVIITEQTNYAEGLEQDLISLLRSRNVRASSEQFPPGTTDLKSYVVRARQKNPQAFVLNGQVESSNVLIFKALRDLQFSGPIYGAYYPSSPAFLNGVGEAAAVGIEYADSPVLNDILTPEGKKLYEEYRKKYEKLRSIEAVFASSVEGFRVMIEALWSGQDPRTYLYTTEFEGIFGKYRFDSTGDGNGFTHVMKRVLPHGKSERIVE